MDLEQRIKKLEDQLALKRAYLNVIVDFNEGVKVSKTIKTKIAKVIKEFCTSMAENIENGTQTVEPAPALTDEDVQVLKQIADKVLGKLKPAPQELREAVKKVRDKSKKKVAPKPKMATLLTRDSLSKDLKSKIDSEEVLKVVKHDDKQASVISKEGYRFVVPMDDIEFQTT